MTRPTGRLLRAVLLTATAAATACGAPEHSIVPMPRDARTGSGTFTLDATTTVALDNADDAAVRVLDLWAAPFREVAGLPLSVGASPEAGLRIGIDGVGEPESYRLEVTPGTISVRGADGPGLFYGLQTLGQLLPPDAETTAAPQGGFEIQSITIDDAPRFAYRGMHLDVARHFFEPEFVKRYIDLLARYKLNRFHWHLTDDQGWRIQIDALPRLTEVGAFRAQTQVGHGSEAFQGDGQPHGGFYTKDEIRDIVAYAEERFITIVPEIEMPGHATAALAAYPQLACTDGPFEVAMTWGVFEDVFCPYEETFAFLETVLTEVMELFPGEYVHLGGDEAPMDRWEDSPYVRRLMQREGMNDVTQVQGWFMRRMAGFLADHGRRLVGWDEILEGGLPADAAVMSWQGIVGGIAASRQGHPVIMTPNSHLYFDYYQSQDVAAEPFAIGGFLPLDTVYAYDPVPGQLREADAQHIIGAQANVWTEYMKTPDQVEYMLMPRMLALSEVVWSPRDVMDFDDFLSRLEWQIARLDALGVKYRPLDR